MIGHRISLRGCLFMKINQDGFIRRIVIFEERIYFLKRIGGHTSLIHEKVSYQIDNKDFFIPKDKFSMANSREILSEEIVRSQLLRIRTIHIFTDILNGIQRMVATREDIDPLLIEPLDLVHTGSPAVRYVLVVRDDHIWSVFGTQVRQVLREHLTSYLSVDVSEYQEFHINRRVSGSSYRRVPFRVCLEHKKY